MPLPFNILLEKSGLIAWPQVLLLAALPRTAHPNSFTLDTELLWVLGNTLVKCEVDPMKRCQDTRRTYRQTESPSIYNQT